MFFFINLQSVRKIWNLYEIYFQHLTNIGCKEICEGTQIHAYVVFIMEIFLFLKSTPIPLLFIITLNYISCIPAYNKKI